jgi:hypothetical protein
VKQLPLLRNPKGRVLLKKPGGEKAREREVRVGLLLKQHENREGEK